MSDGLGQLAIVYPERLSWLWPVLIVALVLAWVLSRPLGDWLHVPRLVAWVVLMSTGVILAGTMTPLRTEFRAPSRASWSCDTSRIGPPGVGPLTSPSDELFNIVMFVPLGFGLALAPWSRRKAVAVAGALGLPILIEGTQMAVASLGRGCQTADVTDNLTGLLLGLGLGTVVAWSMRGTTWHKLSASAQAEADPDTDHTRRLHP